MKSPLGRRATDSHAALAVDITTAGRKLKVPRNHSALAGWKGALTAEQTAQIAGAKQVIYDGFKLAIEQGVSKEKGAARIAKEL